MIYFFYGEDSFRAKQTIDQLKAKFVELYDKNGHNIDYFDNFDLTLEKFFTAAKGSGFLSPKKFILIKNIFSHKKLADIQDPIIEFIKSQKNDKDENYLIFWHEGLPRQNGKLFKCLKKKCSRKCINNFETLKTSRLVKWVQQQAQINNKKIDPAEAGLLISLIGDNTWHLHQEIQKISHSTNSEKIEQADIEHLTTAKSADNMFPFLDAIGEKNKIQALKLFEQLQQTEADFSRLMGMMARQYRLILKAKMASKETRNAYAVSSQLGLPPFIVKKILSQSSKYTEDDLTRTYKELIDIDLKIKSSPEQVRTAITMFITNL